MSSYTGYKVIVNEWSGHTNITIVDEINNYRYTVGSNVQEMDFNAFDGYEGGIYLESSMGALHRTEFNIKQSSYFSLKTLVENQVSSTANGHGYYNAYTTNCVDAVIDWLNYAGVSYDPTTLFQTTLLDGYSTGRYYLTTMYNWVFSLVDPAGFPNYGILDDIDTWLDGYWDGVDTLYASAVEGEVSENEMDLRDNSIHSPISIDLNGNGLKTIGFRNSDILFDLDGNGTLEKTAWLSPDDGFLGIDINGDHIINNGTELFGGAKRGDGYSEIKQYDTNNDGIITIADAEFAKIIVWRDINSNGISESSEIFNLSSLGITSIDLNYTTRDEYDQGNLIGEHSIAQINGIMTAVGDIYFQSNIVLI